MTEHVIFINQNLDNRWEKDRLETLMVEGINYLSILERIGLKDAILSMLAYSIGREQYKIQQDLIIQYFGAVEDLSPKEHLAYYEIMGY